jgi:hypothetical protein
MNDMKETLQKFRTLVRQLQAEQQVGFWFFRLL